MRNVVITGVSGGIGRATAVELVGRGYRVFGSVRDRTTGEELAAELGEGFAHLVFDVTDADAVWASATRVGQVVAEQGLAGLVNNAGITVVGPLSEVDVDNVRRQFEVNVFGLLEVTQAFLPLLRRGTRRQPGRIVNLSSVSGRIVYPFMGAYAASKHAVEAISDAMRRELMLDGIDVVVIEPGTVRTPIIGKAEQQLAQFAATPYGPYLERVAASTAKREATAIPVEVVARTIRVALEARRPKTRYPIPRARFAGWLLPLWLSDRWLDRVMAKQLGLDRRAGSH
jgi:NAD(P)-dependent dehydrogenase (short-subunit alcohol dehydrogenase family)